MSVAIEAYRSSGGARIYRFSLHLFPGLHGFAHLVLADDLVALVDVGSGFGDSNEQLEAGLEAVRNEHGEAVDWPDITHILITHAHIDHFGGLPYVRERTNALLGIHELDRRVLTRYEERMAIVARRLRGYLHECGISEVELAELMDLYLLNKQLFSSRKVDFTYAASGMRLGPFEIIHVPGHTPGHVVLLLDDVMLAGDHILEQISPHLAPERLTLHTGLGHYLESLETVRPRSAEIRLVLGGHEGAFGGLERRIDEIRELYHRRLLQVLEVARRPITIAQLAAHLFGVVEGYHRLLALEEAGAYIEYLHQLGHVGIADLDRYESEPATSIRYHTIDDLSYPFVSAIGLEVEGKHKRMG